MKRLLGLLFLALAILGATGLTVVAPGERAVVRRLGRLLPATWSPGLHWAWPLGLDRVDRIRTDEVRQLEIGLSEGIEDPSAGEYLTGDRNFLRARAVLQYRVTDPIAFALRTADVASVLRRSFEASLAQALANQSIDGVLGAERSAVVDEVVADVRHRTGSQRLGVSVLGVSLTEARPPLEVEPAFAEAQAMRSERDRRRNEAKTTAATTLAAARAEAQARTDRAHTNAARRVLLAQAQADRFRTLLSEASQARELTIRRLYAEALRDLLPRVRRKVMLLPEDGIDLSILGVPRTED